MADSARDRPRILHALALDTIGGVEALFEAYVRAGRDGPLDHHVLVMRGPCHPDIAAGVSASAGSVSYARRWRGIRLPRRLGSLSRRHLERVVAAVRPNAVVMYNTLSNLELSAAARAAGAARIYYERGAAWTSHDPSRTGAFLGEMDLVLCNSLAARRMLELRWGAGVGRARVIHNPLRPDLVTAQVPPKRLSDEVVRLGSVGRLLPIKGFPLAIHALRQILAVGTPCELHLAGEGPELPALRALAARLGVKDQVHFHGLLKDLTSFYSHIHVLLCPSIREPLGNICIEAGHFGCPVIGAAVDGISEVVLDGRTGFCITPTLPIERYPSLGGDLGRLPAAVYDPREDRLMPPRLVAPETIAEAVARLVRNPAEFAAMSDAARRHVGEFFGWAAYLERLNGEFIQAAGTGR